MRRLAAILALSAGCASAEEVVLDTTLDICLKTATSPADAASQLSKTGWARVFGGFSASEASVLSDAGAGPALAASPYQKFDPAPIFAERAERISDLGESPAPSAMFLTDKNIEPSVLAVFQQPEGGLTCMLHGQFDDDYEALRQDLASVGESENHFTLKAWNHLASEGREAVSIWRIKREPTEAALRRPLAADTLVMTVQGPGR